MILGCYIPLTRIMEARMILVLRDVITWGKTSLAVIGVRLRWDCVSERQTTYYYCVKKSYWARSDDYKAWGPWALSSSQAQVIHVNALLILWLFRLSLFTRLSCPSITNMLGVSARHVAVVLRSISVLLSLQTRLSEIKTNSLAIYKKVVLI